MKTNRIMIVAVGGQGNILASRILGDVAVAAGVEVRMSEFHGMAQRGGVVESMVLLGDGRGYCISDGNADVLLGFEPCETIRAAKKCGPHSVVISNTATIPPFTVALGKDRYPDVDNSMKLLSGRVGKLIAFDATSLAVKAGSSLVLNMVMLGAFAYSGAVALPTELFQRIIREKTKKEFVDMNMAAFESGRQTAATGA
jgi:indolepyruvate ferredoxin oxidoreductase beta subunit